jgi:hypothetical protein
MRKRCDWIPIISRCVVGQASGPFQVNDVRLKVWHAQITNPLSGKAGETSITYSQVPREDNQMADLLVNLCMILVRMSLYASWAEYNTLLDCFNATPVPIRYSLICVVSMLHIIRNN